MKDMYQIWIRFVLSISHEQKTMSCSTMICIADKRVNSYKAPEVVENQFSARKSSKS